MNRLLRSILAVGLVTVATVPFASACADNHVTVFIRSVPFPQPPQCTVTNDPSATQIAEGLVDVQFASSYRMTVLVGNQMTPRGDKQNIRAETTRITLDRAEVRLADSTNQQVSCGGNEDCGFFSVPGSGFIDPNSSSDPGYGLFSLEVIPQVALNALAAGLAWQDRTTVIANIRVLGQTLGGEDVESGDFVWPITVCRGCTVTYNTPCCDQDSEWEPVTADDVCSLGVDMGATLIPCQQCTAAECQQAPGATCP